MITTNTQEMQKNWSDMKSKIKTRWSKFNEQDLEGLKGNLDQVSTQIQKTYGIAKDLAEKEYSEFKASLQHGEVKPVAKPAGIAPKSASQGVE